MFKPFFLVEKWLNMKLKPGKECGKTDVVISFFYLN